VVREKAVFSVGQDCRVSFSCQAAGQEAEEVAGFFDFEEVGGGETESEGTLLVKLVQAVIGYANAAKRAVRWLSRYWRRRIRRADDRQMGIASHVKSRQTSNCYECLCL
jgi:hypothetical protein